MSFKLAVLISGNGSNLQAIIDAIANGLPAEIAVVLSNRPDAYGLERAQKANIPTEIISHQDYLDRDKYDTKLIACLNKYQPDLIVLAGFMRILGSEFIDNFHGRIINIHPSLLPKFTGLHTHQRVLDAKESQHGISIHFVTNDLDGGPVICQASFPIRDNDTAEILQQKGHQLEHQMYPEVIDLIAAGRIRQQDHQVILDGKVLPPDGYQFGQISV